MCLKTVFEIFGDSCIEGFVPALQDVDDPAQMIFFSLTGRCKGTPTSLKVTVEALSHSVTVRGGNTPI
jgi:hypothetical protein